MLRLLLVIWIAAYGDCSSPQGAQGICPGKLIYVSRKKDGGTCQLTEYPDEICLTGSWGAGDLQQQYLAFTKQQCHRSQTAFADDLSAAHRQGWLQSTQARSKEERMDEGPVSPALELQTHPSKMYFSRWFSMAVVEAVLVISAIDFWLLPKLACAVAGIITCGIGSWLLCCSFQVLVHASG